ncbi:uncharacterized protein EV154DRAFT_255842 [Mucor mucedo]|uniref:uncharacterized protein n=1 Tax=Mucor mucedo TaxID=29922 RepID=UPI00221E6106|nr:uncharacterized protein EV154DRAFT_255842 [Mucor mucedo]KAI7890281.1 hypothetical protein EV154DRAFT_255842 [Mucor mucedo]
MDSDRSLSGTPGTPGSNMSTSSSLAPGDRIISVKSSIDGIGWDPERRERLEEYVVTVHNITTHAYSLSKYIFLRAIQEDENFDIRRCINRDFFAEVWLKLTRYARGRAGGRTAATRAFIDTYLDDYLEVTGFVPPDFRYGQQASLIEGAKIFTSYSNNVQMRLGSHLRQAVNHLLRIRQRKAELIAYRRREGLIDALIKSEVYRSNMTGIIQNHYVNFRTNHRTAHPLHRKLRLSAYIRRQQGNEDLISKLDEQFGVEAVYVMGNWSSPNARFHEPVRGLGFRRLLQKAGKRVYLIDEFRTSQCCPACERRSLETFRMVDNPRPHRRRANPRVIRHGLLRCTNQNCRAMTNNTNRIVPRLWNRDMAACLNMVDIVRSLRAGNGIPPRFRRGEVPQNQRRRARTQNEQANIRNVRQRRN